MTDRSPRLAIACAAAGVALLAGGARAEEAPASGGPQAATRLAALAPTSCADGRCSVRLEPGQMLALAEKLVLARKYDEARPLVAALRDAPGMDIPYGFLDGLMHLGEGDTKGAVKRFRRVLENHPEQTRVRLELARALMAMRDYDGAEYHLRLAAQDESLPEDIARIIGDARNVIRSNRRLRFGFDFGFAPDSNINSATAAETIDVNFGSTRLPLRLDDAARERSGVGVTASGYASLRLPTAERMSLVFDTNLSMINYDGADFDDYTAQVAGGPEFRLGEGRNLTLQAVALNRWYGGETAARQFGARATLQQEIGLDRRVALQVDARHNVSRINSGYDGWQLGANLTYEQVIAKSAIVSASLIGRREMDDFDAYSNKTLGVSGGIGGELPLGINAGLSGAATWSKFDEAQPFFSFERREDWRIQGRAYVGLRQVRVAGFSPSMEYNYIRVDSNYDLYASDRHRVQFKLARYF
ncbi:hypothetical protein B2G71_00265 [Novosphingobium sp. PC22D]|uniref:porin family protein n=1 Tax=Novosphingobium sp. PC22D TaxID=1962403 RepID=UPI000BEF5EFB|nr:porin family protein [Novosphingobium sp. PC22D]PEQ14096.1 hypothetical protein B2G71_00265 [Novosphingobium sp. PC22D]